MTAATHEALETLLRRDGRKRRVYRLTPSGRNAASQAAGRWRQFALRILQVIGHGDEQLPALVRMLKDSDQTVRKAAQDAIDTLTAQKLGPTEGKKD